MQSGKINNEQLISMSAFEDEEGYEFAAKFARLNRTDFPQGFRGIDNKNSQNRPWIKVSS